MRSYFDVREQRWKPVPDCSRVGCVWDEETQRCERKGLWSRIVKAIEPKQGMGFLFDDPGGGGFFDSFDWGGIFDFAASSAGAAAGDWNFWDIFDLATEFGFDEVTSLQIANGDFGDPADLFGQDVVASISTSEPSALPQAGPLPGTIPYPTGAIALPGPDPSIFQSDADDPGAPIGGPPLPGYCPGGTYHPQSDPYACVPFPADASGRAKAQKQNQAQQKGTLQRIAQMRQACPSGQGRWPYSGKCVPLQCPPGTQRNQATGQCVKVNATQAAQNRQAAAQCPNNTIYDSRAGKCVTPGSSSSSTGPWLLLLGLAAVLVLVEQRRS